MDRGQSLRLMEGFLTTQKTSCMEPLTGKSFFCVCFYEEHSSFNLEYTLKKRYVATLI